MACSVGKRAACTPLEFKNVSPMPPPFLVKLKTKVEPMNYISFRMKLGISNDSNPLNIECQ